MKQNKYKKQVIKNNVYNIKYTLKEEIQYFYNQPNCYFYTVIESPSIVVKLSNSNNETMNHYYQQEVFAWTKIKEEKTPIPLLKPGEQYHPNLLEIKAAFRQVVKDNEMCVLILEYCPKGSLNQIFERLPQYALKEIQIVRIARDILSGLQFLQTRQNPLIHRNINMYNIFFGEDDNYKIGNFQNVTTHFYTSVSSEDFASVDQEIQKNCSEDFRAPEQIFLDLGFPINEMADVYAVGIILYILSFNKKPFEKQDLQTMNKVITLPDFPKYSKNFQTLIQKLLAPNPTMRPRPTILLQFILSAWPDLKVPQTKTGLLDSNVFKQQEIEIKQNTISKLMIFVYNKSTKGWLMATLQESQEGPNQSFIRKLIIKAWQKPYKIQKFYEQFMQYLTPQNAQNTIVSLKSLILLHHYVKKGPLEAVSKNQTNTTKKGCAYDILNLIIATWQNIDPKDDSQDKIRSIFTTKLINMYAQRIRQKVNLANQYPNVIEGSFSLKPFFEFLNKNNAKQQKIILKWQMIDDMMNYMNQLIPFSHEILSQNILLEIQMSLYACLVDEMYCLLCTITFLLVAFIKASSCFADSKNKQAIESKIQDFQNKYENIFDQCVQLFKKFSQLKNFVNILIDDKVLEYVMNLKPINNQNEGQGEINLLQIINQSKSIYGLYLPASYGYTIPSNTEEQKNHMKNSAKKKEIQTQNKNEEIKNNNSNQNSFEQKKQNKRNILGGLLGDQDIEDFNSGNQYEHIELENKNSQLLREKQQQQQQLQQQQNKQQLDRKNTNNKKSIYEEKNAINESYDEENETCGQFTHQLLNQLNTSEQIQINFEQYKNFNFFDFSEFQQNNNNKVQPQRHQYQQSLNFNFNDQKNNNGFDIFDNFNNFQNPRNSLNNQQLQQQQQQYKQQQQFQQQQQQQFQQQFNNFDFWNFNNTVSQKPATNNQQFKYEFNFNNNNIEKTIQQKDQKNQQQQNDIFQQFNIQNFDCQQQTQGKTPQKQQNQQNVNQWNQVFNDFSQQKQNDWQNFNQNDAFQDFNEDKNKNANNQKEEHNSTSSFNSESIQELKQFIINRVQHNPKDIIINYNRLTFGKQIGSGHSAKVYKGQFNQIDVAIKEITVNSMNERNQKEFQREIEALVKIQPQINLVSLIGVTQKEDNFYIITELCNGGSMFQLLHKQQDKPLQWLHRIKMSKDIAIGMIYLHDLNPPIIHRDLKSLNLLLDVPFDENSFNYNIKIADFGLSRTQSQDPMTSVLGTFHWMAPEVFERKQYTTKADVYSYGIVLYEICFRKTPYQKMNTVDIMKAVTEGKRPQIDQIPADCPEAFSQLMKDCWSQNPNNRPDFKQVLERLNQMEKSLIQQQKGKQQQNQQQQQQQQQIQQQQNMLGSQKSVKQIQQPYQQIQQFNNLVKNNNV